MIPFSIWVWVGKIAQGRKGYVRVELNFNKKKDRAAAASGIYKIDWNMSNTTKLNSREARSTHFAQSHSHRNYVQNDVQWSRREGKGGMVNPFVHGRFSRPITHIENDIKRFLYIHIAYPYFCLKFFFVLCNPTAANNL